MSTKYKATTTEEAYFITITTVGWIDVFTRLNQKGVIVNALNYCQKNKGLEIYAYCIMSSHIHIFCKATNGFILSDVLRDFKKFISKKIVQQIQTEPESRREWMLELFSKEASDRHKNFKFWQSGNNAIELYNEKFTWDKVNYINDNPVRSGLVKNQEDWVYSSASNYHGKKSILSVEIISAPLNYGIKKW